jgi:hypothetical protein
MENKNTKFWFAKLVGIHVACGLYKLVYTSQYLHRFEPFIIKKSIIMHLVLHEFFHALNAVFRIQVKWLKGNDLVDIIAL